MNGETKRPADLISMPLDHKLYAVEGIRSIPSSIASIYLSKNIFDELFGEKLVKMKLQTQCVALAITIGTPTVVLYIENWRLPKINLSPNFTPSTPNL